MSSPLARVIRGGMVESIHRGDIAVVDSSGRILHCVGDPENLTYWRSSAKPVQTMAVVLSGAADRFVFTNRELAVMCASHYGEDIHLETVRGILAKIGLKEDCLRCGVHLPYDQEQARILMREGRPPTEVHNNCSGKHAGMLALAVHEGLSIHDYYLPDHPVQRKMLDIVAKMACYDRESIKIGVDGCGVAVFYLPVASMALAYARLADPDGLDKKTGEAAARVTRAMMDHPEMVEGTNRFTTSLMEAAEGSIFAKGGAEGVFCLGLPKLKIGVAVKIEDGSSRAVRPAVMQVLADMGLISDRMAGDARLEPDIPLRNARKELVGRLEPCFRLPRV